MAYERLNLPNGIIMNADHMKHIEDGIVSAENQANNLETSKQDKLSGKTGQVVGFDASGNAVAQDAPEGGGNVVPTVEPAEDDIPKVFFGKTLPQMKIDEVMSFRYVSKTQDIKAWCITKAQGNSSTIYPKKNQTVKLYSDEACTEKLKVDFKGWGKQNKFCFKANWIDITHARNVVSARLWGDIVRSRPSYASLPEELRSSPNQGAIDGFPVKVYANGVYQGRYTLNIPKDPWMTNMDDDLDTHCILYSENYNSGCFRAPAVIDGTDWTDEVHDTVPESIKTRWNECISFVMNSDDDTFKANIENYFDLTSLLDYDLFGLLICGIDSFGKNQIYMTYDGGAKWYASMYDLDSTWGLYWNGSKILPSDYPRHSYEDSLDGKQGNLLYERIEKLFKEELRQRWTELKNSVLSIEWIINRFERFVDICPPWLVAEDYAETTANGRFTGIPSVQGNNIQHLRDFAKARLGYVEEYLYAEIDEDIDDGLLYNGLWTTTPKYNIDQTTGSVVSGDMYITKYYKRPNDTETTHVQIANAGNTTFNYFSIVQYDSELNFVKYETHLTNTTPFKRSLEPNTAYVRCTAYPKNKETDTNPSEQLSVTYIPAEYNEHDWSVSANYRLSREKIGIDAGYDFVTRIIDLDGKNANTVTIENVGGATFNFMRVFEYDSAKNFVFENDTFNSTAGKTTILKPDTRYIRCSASPNNVSTNNNPGEQISITFA